MIEELLEGPEVSLFALCDGTRAVPLGAAQDFKRAGDGDARPEHRRDGRVLAGRRGSTTPDALVEQIHQPVVDELARRGTPFIGCLFAGLMLTADGPRVLEFNARFGDPETQVLIPRLEGDLLGSARRGRRRERERGRSREGRRRSDGRARRARLSGSQRLHRRADHGDRGGRGGRRTRLPRRERPCETARW